MAVSKKGVFSKFCTVPRAMGYNIKPRTLSHKASTDPFNRNWYNIICSIGIFIIPLFKEIFMPFILSVVFSGSLYEQMSGLNSYFTTVSTISLLYQCSTSVSMPDSFLFSVVLLLDFQLFMTYASRRNNSPFCFRANVSTQPYLRTFCGT